MRPFPAPAQRSRFWARRPSGSAGHHGPAPGSAKPNRSNVGNPCLTCRCQAKTGSQDATHQRHSQDRVACRTAVVQRSAKGRRVEAHRRSEPTDLAFGVIVGEPFDMVPTEGENRSTDWLTSDSASMCCAGLGRKGQARLRPVLICPEIWQPPPGPLRWVGRSSHLRAFSRATRRSIGLHRQRASHSGLRQMSPSTRVRPQHGGAQFLNAAARRRELLPRGVQCPASRRARDHPVAAQHALGLP